MTYLQALRLMVKAYKAARGVMPKGIDLLKMKMRARQKAIDSTKGKVIQFPKERITDPFKARPQPPKIEMKGGIQTTRGMGDLFKRQLDKVTERVRRTMKEETDAQTIARMKKQNKDSVARLKEKKDLGDKLKDLPDDIPDMAEGGVASAIKKIKRRFGKKSITTGDKIKRPGNRQLFDDFKKRNKYIIGGKVRRNVTPEPLDPKLQNLIDVYESNPTLQSSMSIDDYLMQAYRPTTPTTEELATGITTQATQPVIKPIKPIIPITESGDGGGGPGPKGFNKGFSSANFGLGPNKDVVDYEAEAYGIGRTPLGTASAVLTGIPSITKLGFQFAKSVKEKSQKALEDFFAAREAAKAAEVARIARQNLAASMGSDAGPGEGAGTFGASVNEATGARGPGTGFSDYS